MMLLSGCSGTVETVMNSMSDTEWDTVIDGMLDKAVDILLEKDSSTESQQGNTAPEPPPTIAVPEISSSRYYNDHHQEIVFRYMVYAEEVVTLGGGWEVGGLLMEESQIHPEAVAAILAEPNGTIFTYEFKEVDAEGNLLYHTVECVTTGTSSYNTVYFEYEWNGQQILRTMEQNGVVTDDYGYILYQPKEHQQIFVPFGADLIDGEGQYSNMVDFAEARISEEYPDALIRYVVEVAVSEHLVTSLLTK